jgi:hypothetical protein
VARKGVNDPFFRKLRGAVHQRPRRARRRHHQQAARVKLAESPPAEKGLETRDEVLFLRRTGRGRRAGLRLPRRESAGGRAARDGRSLHQRQQGAAGEDARARCPARGPAHLRPATPAGRPDSSRARSRTATGTFAPADAATSSRRSPKASGRKLYLRASATKIRYVR